MKSPGGAALVERIIKRRSRNKKRHGKAGERRAEFDETLNALLSNPRAWRRSRHLAKSLSGLERRRRAVLPRLRRPRQLLRRGITRRSASGHFGPSLLSHRRSGPKLLMKLLPLVQELGSQQNSNATLLFALRPYLKEERQEKVERALQLAVCSIWERNFWPDGGSEGCITATFAATAGLHPHPEEEPPQPRPAIQTRRLRLRSRSRDPARVSQTLRPATALTRTAACRRTDRFLRGILDQLHLDHVDTGDLLLLAVLFISGGSRRGTAGGVGTAADLIKPTVCRKCSIPSRKHQASLPAAFAAGKLAFIVWKVPLLIILLADFKIALRIAAYRADLRGLASNHQVSADAAFPHVLLALFKNLLHLHIFQQRTVALLVGFSMAPTLRNRSASSGKALHLGVLRHAVVHVRPLVVLPSAAWSKFFGSLTRLPSSDTRLGHAPARCGRS